MTVHQTHFDPKDWNRTVKRARRKGLRNVALICITQIEVGHQVWHKINMMSDVMKATVAPARALAVARGYEERFLETLGQSGHRVALDMWIHPIFDDEGSTLRETAQMLEFLERVGTPEQKIEAIHQLDTAPCLAQVTLDLKGADSPAEDIGDLVGQWGFGKVSPGTEA